MNREQKSWTASNPLSKTQLICFSPISMGMSWQHQTNLKGKFSSGIEGALASTLNHDFNWKQLSELILCIFFDVFKVYLSNIDSETAEI